ncbi:MAG: hypothetical protein AMXMBFR64_62140 [Myxococcales bacterium]
MNQRDPELQEERIAALERELADLRRHTGLVAPRDGEPQGDPPRRSLVLALVIAGIVVLIAGGLGVLIYSEAWAKVDGVFSSSGDPLGRFDAYPSDCRSGAAFLPPFLGAEIGSAATGLLRIQGSGKTATVTVWAPGSPDGRAYDASRCSTFDAVVTLAGSEVNEVRAVDGHLRMECTDGAATVRADLTFDACH